MARIRDLLRWWLGGEPPAFGTVSAASAGLREASAGRQVLLVLPPKAAHGVGVHRFFKSLADHLLRRTGFGTMINVPAR